MQSATRGANGTGRIVLITWLVVFAVALIAMSDAAHADGKFFGVQRVGKDPTIRSQSAIIVHKGGVQTLIVGSLIDASAGSMGWILPLPAEPTEIDLATIGTLETLEMMLQPRVLGEREVSGTRQTAIFVLWFSAFVTLLLAATYLKSRARQLTWQVVTVVVMLAVGVLVLGTLSTARGSAVFPAVTVAQSKSIGPYEVNIVRGESADAIAAWCDANGITLNSAERSVIEQYRADDWCFMTAILSPSADGVLRQPPLKVTFPCTEPVYPMRLTGVTDDPLELDLFTFADTGLRADGLTTWWRGSVRDAEPDSRVNAISGTYNRHPHIAPLLWDGVVVSRLHGRLDPADMKQDIRLVAQNNEPHRHEFISRANANKFIFWWFTFGLSVTMLVAVCIPRAKVRDMIALTLLAISIVVPLVIGYVTFDVREGFSQPVPIGHFVEMPTLMNSAANDMAEAIAVFDSVKEVEAAFHQHIEYSHELMSTGRDVPNGVVIEERDGFWYATIYDSVAAPTEHRIGRVGEPESGE